MRTTLEGGHTTTVGKRMSIRTTVETGLRQDGGDAETGAGVDIGAGLALTAAASGLGIELRMRRLLVHQAEEFSENGMSIWVIYNPAPATPLGFSARVAPGWGGETMGGAEALWRQDSIGPLGLHDRSSNANRLDTEIGYGLPVGARFVGAPRVGLRTSQHGRDYRVGYALKALERRKVNLELRIDAERRETTVFDLLQRERAGADQRVSGHASLGW